MKLPRAVAAAALATSISMAPFNAVVPQGASFNSIALAADGFLIDGAETSPLLEELKRRTEANRETNAATVKAVTESNTCAIAIA